MVIQRLLTWSPDLHRRLPIDKIAQDDQEIGNGVTLARFTPPHGAQRHNRITLYSPDHTAIIATLLSDDGCLAVRALVR